MNKSPLQSMRGAFCLLLIILAAASCRRSAPAPAPVESLTVTSSGGMQLAATFYPASKPNAPGIVFVHMLGVDRHSWDPFATRAREAGYNCISFDMRGHGETRTANGDQLSYKNFSTDDWMGVLNDIDAARKKLLEKGARPDAVAVIGASIGANLALHYGARDPEIAAVVMVSPGLDYHGVTAKDALAQYGKRPLLLMSSQGDAYSDTSCSTLKAQAPGLCEYRQYQGGAHGTDLLDISTTASEEVLLWLSQMLPK